MKKILICITALVVSFSIASAGMLYAWSGTDSTGYLTDGGTSDSLILSGNAISTDQDSSNGYGLFSKNGSSITLNNGSIRTTGYNASGGVTEGSFLTINDSSILTIGSNSHGVALSAIGNSSLSNVDIDTQGAGSIGIHLTGDSSLTMSGGNIETHSTSTGPDYATYGVEAQNNSIVKLTDVNIVTHGTNYDANDGVFGLLSITGSVISMDGGSITTYGNIAHDASAYDGNLDLKNVSITTNNTGAAGVYSQQETTSGGVELTGVNIVTSGADAYGLLANGGNITASGGSITTTGNRSVGAYALTGSAVSLDGTTVTTSGADAYGLLANGGNITASGGSITTSGINSAGAYALTGGVVSLDGTTVTTSGASSYGLLTATGGNITASGGSITTTGADSMGASALTGGSVSLKDIAIVTTGVSADAVLADAGTMMLNGAVLSVDSSLAAAIRATGTSASATGTVSGADALYIISGDIIAENYGSIDMTLANVSVFTGSSSVGAANSTLALALNGPDTLWNVTGSSTLTTLDLNGSTVDYTGQPSFMTITTADLNSTGSSGGNLLMKTDIVNQSADMLIVTGTTSGQHNITVNDIGSAATDGTEITPLVTTADQNGLFTLTNGAVDVGGWTYLLRQNTTNYSSGGAGWELYAQTISPPADGGINSFYGSYLLVYAETETLMKRLGDLRDTSNASGVWARIHGGKFSTSNRGRLQKFDMDYGGIQIGYDRKIESKGWKGDVYAGIMFGYSNADLDYMKHGDGEIDSKMVGIYGTWTHPNGFFADLIVKYQWMDNDFDVTDSSGTLVHGNGVNVDGVGVSLELGKRLRIDKNKDSGWYVEPQVQLSYMRQDSAHFNASNGLSVGIDGYTSLLGRLGALIGYENEDKTRNAYFKVSKVKEFGDDITVSTNGVPYSYRFGNSWWVYGVGFTAQLSGRNSIYMDIERTSGAYFTQDWSARLGWRMSF